jgi:sugar lactone lactonase YvrE
MMISMSKLKFAKTCLYGLLPCLMLAAATWANAATKVITVAGGYAGNGKPATAAGIDQLSSVAMDAKGNLYVTDSGNCQIRKINSKGVIVKFAGTKVCGFSGDGGPAASAMINSPSTIVFDGAGNLLFGDEGNSRIRKITPTGIISTIAGNGTVGYSGDGGPATDASLYGPTSLFVDSANNIYITDAFNYVVRKIDAAGVIHTVAGNNQPGFAGDGGPATSAQISYSSGIVADAQGNFYIADANNHRVRKVDASGSITTYAGNGQFGNGGDGGPATGASLGGVRGLLIRGGKLYITTSSNVWAVSLATQKITIIAGDAGGFIGFNGDGKPALATTFQFPWGMSFDSAGRLLIADEGNARVRRIGGGKIVRTIAGGHTGDGGPARESNLNAGFFGGHITFDPSGNLYLADSGNFRVRKISTAGVITTIAGNGIAGYSGDGGPATEAMLGGPSGVAADGAGNVYIADNNSVIRKVDSNGIITTFATMGANGMAVDGAGNLYVAGFFNNVVWKFTPQGAGSIVAGVQSGFGYNGDGIPATEAWLGFPTGVAVDNAGNLYIADWLNNRIRRVDTSGIISTVAGNGNSGFSGDGGPATSAMIWSALDVAVDAKGNFYIADSSNFRIRMVDASGTIHTLAGSGDAGYNGNALPATATNMFAVAVGVSPTGVVYLMDTASYRLRKVQ